MDKDFKHHPRQTYAQGDSLVEWIYHHYRRLHTLPDSTHNLDNGFLTTSLLNKAIDLSKGNLPLLRFSTKLLAYASSRVSQYNSTLSIHSDRLKEWSSEANYLRYFKSMQQAGLLGIRGDSYSVDRYAKRVDASMLVHEYEEAKAINSQEDKERVASTLEEWLKYAYPQASDYASKLKSLQVDRKAINKQVSTLYNESMPVLKSKRMHTQERIAQYLRENPKASTRNIAKALELNQSTVSRNILKK